MGEPMSLKSAMLGIVVITQILFAPVLSPAQSGGFAITPIVRRGEPSPDKGRFFDCNDCEGRINGIHAFNNREEVGILADTEGLCGFGDFLVSQTNSIQLACPPPFGQFNLVGWVNVNDRGQAVVLAGPLTDGRIVSTLSLYSENQLMKIIAEGDPTPMGTIFRGCGFSEPSINNLGEVAFSACTDDQIRFLDGVFVYSGGEIRKVVTTGDPSPIGGIFALNLVPPQRAQIDDKGEILFLAGVFPDSLPEKLGLFLATAGGFKKIVVDGDPMPIGGAVTPNTFSFGDLNGRGDVVFAVGLTGSQTDSGIFLYSADGIHKIMLQGEPTPLGGTFFSLSDKSFTLPRVNANGAVAFKIPIVGGGTTSAIFLASTKAVVKVVAVGDQLPTGETIKVIDTFALNDLGQVAFFAYGKKDKTKPLGVYVATPLSPEIRKVKLKRKRGVLELRVNGSAMITNGTVIEINGTPLNELSYPEGFRENGGLTTRVISRDPRLDQLIQQGQTVQVTVFNSLTSLRSKPKTFTR